MGTKLVLPVIKGSQTQSVSHETESKVSRATLKNEEKNMI